MSDRETRVTTTRGGDPFGRVLGPGRGLSEMDASREELGEALDKLAALSVQLAEALDRERKLQDELTELGPEMVDLTEQRDTARRLSKYAEANQRLAEDDRDRARYACMRNGQPDPGSHNGMEETHQREWTAGRPYLAYQHAWHPKTGECYRACNIGAPTGETPGAGRHWERCLEPDLCPRAPALPDEDERTLSGWELRKTELSWGRDPSSRTPRELTDTELANIIGYLRANAPNLCAEERAAPEPILPCPSNAYPSAAAWMADMPLMRALLRERRRRRNRHGRGPHTVVGNSHQIVAGEP